MTKIYYNFDSYTQVTRTGDPEDQWDGDDTSTSWSAPDKVSLTPISGWLSDSDELPWEVKVGDTIYMTWIQYSTGDSFSRSEGEYSEVLGWYQNVDDANKCRDLIENESETGYSFDKGGNIVNVPTFDGTGTRPVYTGSWKGYFESLDHVSVEVLRVVP